jgi:hypothetical protein
MLRTALAALLLVTPALAQPTPPDNIGHTRHHHHHNDKHPTDAPSADRFVTSRKSDIVLPLPQEKDAFSFVVFGDRTGGPVDGVKVLADAVRDVNLLEPDLVMTVGDLINGYNATPQWMEQMTEYKGIMDHLLCPWFPVVGNHDLYMGSTPNKPRGEHEKEYEMHFGPLWYAFKHKNCWFIALHSDEGNPDTGEKAINKPEAQRMSDEQFTWLKDTLSKAKDAEHVFLFLHHPRWVGGNYGDDWDKVHKELVAAGNVTAVFAGHIHRMRYDPKDGIEYVTLATVGGHQDSKVPDAGWLHHYNIITVRKDQVAMAAVPVGDVIDIREITGQFAEECARMVQATPKIDGVLRFQPDAGVRETIKVKVENPTTRDADVTVLLDSADSRWISSPDHNHARVAAGMSAEFEFSVLRPAGHADPFTRRLEAVVDADVLMPGHRYALPTRRLAIPLTLENLPAPEVSASEVAMAFDGDDAVVIDNAAINLPDGAFTLECWFNADRFAARTGLLCKTENADYGIFVNNARPHFSVFLGNDYVTARAPKAILTPGTWHHVAGVFDGAEVRLYVDGTLVDTAKGAGKRKTNTLPLVIGADVGGDALPTSFFKGRIDAVRLSTGAQYTGAAFTPVRRPGLADATVILSNMDGIVAGGLWLERPRAIVGEQIGAPRLVPAE